MPYLYVVIVAVAIGAFLILKRRLAHYVAWTVMVLGMVAGCGTVSPALCDMCPDGGACQPCETACVLDANGAYVCAKDGGQ